MGAIHIVWICGPPGVGKSAVGWDLFQRSAAARPAYVDIDQLGLRYPSPADDPDNFIVKVDNLARLIGVHAASGAASMIVSGLADAESVVRLRRALPGVGVFVCRLRADAQVVVARHAGRTGDSSMSATIADEAERADATDFADLVLDTTEQVPRDIAVQLDAVIAARIGDLPALAGVPRPHLPTVTQIHGPRAVGSSAVAFRLFSDLIGEGRTVAYLDMAQVAFQQGLDGEALVAHQVAAIASLGDTYRSHGAERLIIVGALHPALRDAVDRLPQNGADRGIRSFRLTADDDAIAARVGERAVGGPLHLAGDDIRGADAAAVRRITLAAQAQARALDGDQSPEDTVIDTSAMSVDEVVRTIRATM